MGRPTRDCLFVDVARDGVSALKLWNFNGEPHPVLSEGDEPLPVLSQGGDGEGGGGGDGGGRAGGRLGLRTGGADGAERGGEGEGARGGKEGGGGDDGVGEGGGGGGAGGGAVCPPNAIVGAFHVQGAHWDFETHGLVCASQVRSSG